jgi:hypothetical protein
MTDTHTNDTPSGEDVDWEAFAAAETKRYQKVIQAFRDAATALGRERAAECDFPYDDLLRAMLHGQVVLAEEFRSYSYFVTDMWPGLVGQAAEDAAAHMAESTRQMAAVYGQVHALPQVTESGGTRFSQAR